MQGGEPGEHAPNDFVGELGTSGLIYAEAHWSQSLPNWTRARVRMFAHFGGTPQIAAPDNLKTGVAKANFYDPDLQSRLSRNGRPL